MKPSIIIRTTKSPHHRRPSRARVSVAIACLFSIAQVSAGEVANTSVRKWLASDSADVVATIDRFHSALVAGDSATALSLLADDAMVAESGSIETRAEYRAHHLPADIEFARAIPSKRSVVRVTVQGDAAWVVSTSTTQGQTGGRTVNSIGAELTVLRRGPRGWQIAAVHWSSRNRRPPS